MRIKNINKKQTIALISIFVIILAVIIVMIITDGNKEVLFKLENIYVTSSANGTYNDENNTEDWNIKLYQNNDIYIKFGLIENAEKISKNNSKIKEAYIENFNVLEKPFLGTSVKTYKISQNEEKLFEYQDEYLINEKLQLNVVEKDAKTYKVEVNKYGGQVALSVVNENVATNTYEDKKEMQFDGTLLQALNITNNEIYFKVSFNLVIITEANNKYVSNIILELPYGDIIQNGFELKKDVDISNMQFKYIK